MTLVAKVQHIRPQISYVLYNKSHSLKDAEIAELQQKLDKAMGMLQSLQSGQPAPARRAGSTPTTPVVTPQNKMIPKKASPPCQTSAPSSGEAPETPDDNSEARIFLYVETTWCSYSVFLPICLPAARLLAMQEKREQAKLEARLRRLCGKKPSGKIQVPEDVHQAWKAGGVQRENIMEIFVNSGCDKVTCVARNFVSC